MKKKNMMTSNEIVKKVTKKANLKPKIPIKKKKHAHFHQEDEVDRSEDIPITKGKP